MTTSPADAKLPEVSLADIAIPIDLCSTVSEGRVDPRSVTDLRSKDFTQAVVSRRGEPFLYGLVTVEWLEHLNQEGLPLSIDDPSVDRFVLKSYGAGPAGYELSMLGPLDPISRLRVMRPVVRLDRLLEALSTRAAVLVEWHETTELLNGTRVPGADPESDPEVVGLVTTSDLNKHPIRVVIYGVLAGLETVLAEVVRTSVGGTLGWVDRLSEESQARILGYWEMSKRQGVDAGPMVGATLADLLNLTALDKDLRSKLGYGSRKVFDAATGRIPGLRNQTMHPVRPLVSNSESCTRLADILKETIGLTERARALLGRQRQPQ